MIANSAFGINESTEGKEKPKSEVEKESVDANKKAETPKTDPATEAELKQKEEAKKVAPPKPVYFQDQDSTSNSLNKYNFIFYFIYKYKYESPGESLRKWFD